MPVETRPATLADAPFIAWVKQEAARSHLAQGIWDIAFPGEDAQRLAILEKIATTERVHFGHFSRFRVLEVDGVPASAMAVYENSEHGEQPFRLGIAEALTELRWSPQELQTLVERFGSFAATGYPNPDGLWIIEWVATRPEFRGRSLVHRLLLEVLEEGRERGFARAQIGYLLGNVRAKSAYERVGFKWVEEHCHPDFEREYGTPGIARMQRDL
ncbi:MAG: GNAT family N-acetyltransferase [Myxococcota bacterium]